MSLRDSAAAATTAGVGTVEDMTGFVDVHSHVLPSGDDGAQTLDDAVALCRAAAARGTRILFATPHVWRHLPVTPEREREVRAAWEHVAARAGLELRLGWELTPSEWLLREDLRRYELERTGAVLMEVPFDGPADLLVRLAERAERQGLRPVIAHPERTEAVRERPALAWELARRGWLLQVNATSLLGQHDVEAEEIGWELLESGAAALVASDGHRTTRPAHLDRAYELACARLGRGATRCFDGSALGFGARALRAAAS